MTLSPADQRLLREILRSGHALEASWGQSSDGLDELCLLIRSAALAESVELQRLTFHERNLSREMTGRHLATILVPFERLNGRALQDPDFLIDDTDNTTKIRETYPLMVIADNLRSAFNVGGILRTSEAMGVERVILTGYTPTPEETKTSRTSMGADQHVPWEQVARVEDAITSAQAKGYQVVALETATDAISMDEFVWPEKCALLLGNERFGVESTVLVKADHVVRIPLQGVKNSLNVGIAFGIAAASYRARVSHPLRPIGYFETTAQHPYEARRQGSLDKSGARGFIRLERGQQYEQALHDVAGFERLWLVFGFHHNQSWKPKTLPPRGPLVKRGVFATRSPYRPNGLGLSSVKLVSVEGLLIEVRGFDLLNGTPIYDIKPYLPYADAFPGIRAGWTDELDMTPFLVELSNEAYTRLRWLEENGVDQLSGLSVFTFGIRPNRK